MVIKTTAQLDKLIREVLLAVGADERNANRVAEALVLSTLRGVDTHGILHLPSYVEKIQNGEIVPTAWPEIRQEDATSALIAGNWTFGHVTAKYAMKVAIEKAKSHNVAVVSAVQINHIGRPGRIRRNRSRERDAINNLGWRVRCRKAGRCSFRWTATSSKYEPNRCRFPRR